MQDTISAKGQRWDVGVKYPNGRTTNTGVERKGTIISYLIAFERLFRTKQTKKEPACSVVEQAGVPIDRVIGGLRERKGLFYLLTIAFGKWIVKELNHSAN
ncbi:MAG: hypothetical protein IKQ50_03510 [Paludibacteraceae bacterium]|nr:hypothetical protein [Paludibacteraceae bacterium]